MKICKIVYTLVILSRRFKICSEGLRCSVETRTAHVGNHYVYNLDLKDFFHSFDRNRVKMGFIYEPFNLNGEREPLAFLLASLCTHPFEVNGEIKNVLPQGSPTSPTITNILCKKLDRRLTGLANRFGAKYTRYADDITFSSPHNIYNDEDFKKELERIISEDNLLKINGKQKEIGPQLKINSDKTRLQKSAYRQEVTGLILNDKVNVRQRYVKQIRMWLYYWEKYGYEKAQQIFTRDYITDKGHVDYGKINELFEIIRDFHFTKPSEAYSFIYKAFHKGYQSWSNYLTFAEWWDLENLRSDDFLKEEYKGKKMMSIAELAYIAYSKKLLEGEPLDSFGQQRVIDKEKIQSFLPKLDSLIEKHPDYQYPQYFKAKLLLALGNDENVLYAFLPFAKQKRNDFWVWELMAEIFQEDKDIQFACYCKALSLNTPEDFLVKLRQNFVEMLTEKRMYNEAKTEIQKVVTTREKHEWKIPNQILQWIEQEWYKTATLKKDNSELYSSHIKQAEEILFQDIPEEIIAVEFVNENKSMKYDWVKDSKGKWVISNFEMHDGFFSEEKAIG